MNNSNSSEKPKRTRELWHQFGSGRVLFRKRVFNIEVQAIRARKKHSTSKRTSNQQQKYTYRIVVDHPPGSGTMCLYVLKMLSFQAQHTHVNIKSVSVWCVNKFTISHILRWKRARDKRGCDTNEASVVYASTTADITACVLHCDRNAPYRIAFHYMHKRVIFRSDSTRKIRIKCRIKRKAALRST